MYMLKTLKMLHNRLFYMDCFMGIFHFLSSQNQMHSQTLHSLPVQNLNSIPHQVHQNQVLVLNQNQILLPNQHRLLVFLTYSHWHKAFGHVDTFARNKSLYEDGEILLNFIKYNCQPCLLSKSVHHPPESSLTRATKPLERIFSDLSKKTPIPSLGGSYYYITFIDDFLCFTWIYFLKEKSQAVAAIKDFINIVENQTS